MGLFGLHLIGRVIFPTELQGPSFVFISFAYQLCQKLSSLVLCQRTLPLPPMPLSCFMHWCCFSSWEYWAQFLGTCLDVLTSCTQLWIWSNWISDPIWRHRVLSARPAGAVKMAASLSLLKSDCVHINGRRGVDAVGSWVTYNFAQHCWHNWACSCNQAHLHYLLFPMRCCLQWYS